MDLCFCSLKGDLFRDALKGIYESGNRLNVLEIGVGTGKNFPFYPCNSIVTLLDKVSINSSDIENSLKKSGRDDLIINEIIQ